jgi:transcriptional regulator of met regulon
MLELKHKIIFIVFGLLAVAYLFVFVVDKNAERKKIERFAEEDEEHFDDVDESFEEEEDEEEEKKPKSKKEKFEDKESKDSKDTKEATSPKDKEMPEAKHTAEKQAPSLAQVMSSVSSYVQEKLPKHAEQMKVLKELFNEKNMDTLQQLKHKVDIQHFVNTVIDKFTEKPKEDTVSDEMKQKLDSIKVHLKKVQEDVDTLYKKTPLHSERFQPSSDTYVHSSKSPKGSHTESKKTSDVIEGFENVRSLYASY